MLRAAEASPFASKPGCFGVALAAASAKVCPEGIHVFMETTEAFLESTALGRILLLLHVFASLMWMGDFAFQLFNLLFQHSDLSLQLLNLPS